MKRETDLELELSRFKKKYKQAMADNKRLKELLRLQEGAAEKTFPAPK